MERSKSIFSAAGLNRSTPIFKKGGEILSSEDNTMSESKVMPSTLKSRKEISNGAFIGKMFHMRDISHLLHLKSKSYAEHKALNKFYDGLLDYTDSVAEMMQSAELLDIRIPASIIERNPLDYISTFRNEVQDFKDDCDCDDVIATLDEVIGLCNSTLYKLKFLK